MTEQQAAELEFTREKPDVVEISHPAVCNAKHHHRLKLFRHECLPAIGTQVRSRKLKNREEFDVLRWRRGGGADGCPGIFCLRLGHKMETDQMSRSIVLEGLRWDLNTPWTDPLRRPAANPDYGAVIECQLAGIPQSCKRSLCFHKP